VLETRSWFRQHFWHSDFVTLNFPALNDFATCSVSWRFGKPFASKRGYEREFEETISGRLRKMKIKVKFGAIFLAASILFFLSLPAFPSPANPPQDQGTAQTPPVEKGKKQKAERGPGKEIGKGGEDIGKGAGKGAESMGKGTAGAAGNLATLHPGKAGADLGKGAGSAGKDVGVGAGKGTAKIGKGSAKGIGKLGKKVFGRGNKNKKSED
jgi:hypothetical protein